MSRYNMIDITGKAAANWRESTSCRLESCWAKRKKRKGAEVSNKCISAYFRRNQIPFPTSISKMGGIYRGCTTRKDANNLKQTGVSHEISDSV